MKLKRAPPLPAITSRTPWASTTKWAFFGSLVAVVIAAATTVLHLARARTLRLKLASRPPSKEDAQALTRMEGEGGPVLPVPEVA